MGVDAGDGAAEDVARRIAAGLHGGDTDRFQPPRDRDGADPDPVELDVLTRGEIEIAVTPERMRLGPACVLVGDLADSSAPGEVMRPPGILMRSMKASPPCRCG